ncbi:hypothetical protein J2TS6_42740 [Paenibacillus albilobatus]|uniref:Baseplate J/gp47 family protein n=1 Tax=Paenibacillus albilobatus TaxID=2716884 RepID=A0A920CCT5_9BACL|nr:baseplate J/gp47 family protein [Paenibacillus albilobatus]GIO33133.1 hypothetical protein J2TS6_42740 [Paenibacillus albilobatus]
MEYIDLPDIQFVEEDVEKVLTEIVTLYQTITKRTLFRADPEMIFLKVFAQYIVQHRVLINRVAKGELLRYASGIMLDYLGGTDTPRLEATSARTTVRFTLSVPLVSAQLVPKGTRITQENGDGSIFFETNEAAIIPPGDLTADILCVCMTPGDIGNGLLPGQLNVLVDPLPFVQSVANVTTSAGGTDREEDDHYRERIRLAPESYSTAGPEDSYIYWAKRASAAIIDVEAESPSPMEVKIVPLLEGGTIPGQEVLDAVAEAVNSRKRRPLTDRVTVSAPETVPYDINLTYYIDISRAAESATIQDAVKAAVDSYRVWQKSKLGRAINQSELIARVMQAGAQRVNVVSPVYTEVAKLQVAQDETVSVTFGGLVDD